jgi:hypothetical protein
MELPGVEVLALSEKTGGEARAMSISFLQRDSQIFSV